MNAANVVLAVMVVAVVAVLYQRVEVANLKATVIAAEAARDVATGDAAALRVAAAVDKALATAYQDIGEEHERDRAAAEDLPAAVVADLRAGNRRLRHHWAACETSRLAGATATALERDAAAQRREADYGNLVRVGRDADDQLRACQAVVLAWQRAGLTGRDRAGAL